MADYYGQAPKKETVYEGPVPSQFGGPAAAGGTAVKETVYNGPVPGARETVFDQSKFVAQKTDSTIARKTATTQVRWASLRFFIVAAFSLWEAGMYWNHRPVMGMFNLLVGLVFLTIGIFAYRLSKTAFMIAFGLYGLDSAILLLAAIMVDGGFLLFLYPLIIHAVILYRLWVAMGTLEDLHSLDD